MLYVSERVGANDVVIAPSDPDVIYVSMWENNPGTVGSESGVYKSEDGGKSFTRMRGGLPDGPRTGRIGVAVSWTDPDKAYALIDNFNLEENKTGEVYQHTGWGPDLDANPRRTAADLFAYRLVFCRLLCQSSR